MSEKLGFRLVESKNILRKQGNNFNLCLSLKNVETVTVGDSVMTGTVVDSNRGDLCF